MTYTSINWQKAKVEQVKTIQEDKTYNLIFNTYVIANSFWVLVIRAEFTNRFAYLSWFLLGLVIVYPYLKAKFFHNQGVVLGKVIAVYFAFTYVMHLLQK